MKPELDVPVSQNADSAILQRAGYFLSANAKIVIAENRESSLLRFDPGKNFGNRFDISARIRHEVPGKRDQIGFKLVDHLHSLPQQKFGKKNAQMNVSKLDDPKSVQCRGQNIESNAMLGNLEIAAHPPQCPPLALANIANRIILDTTGPPKVGEPVNLLDQSRLPPALGMMTINHR